jgi:hypothetical protein
VHCILVPSKIRSLEREFVEFVGCRSGVPFRATTDQVIVANYKVVPGVSRNFRTLGKSRESEWE